MQEVTEHGSRLEKGTNTLGFWSLVFAQGLATFNDNAFRQSIILCAFAFYAGTTANLVQSLSTGLMLLPFALLSLLAGVFADKFSKRRVFVFWKALEIPMVIAGTIGLMYARNPTWWSMALMLAMLFLLGMQTAFLAPARYGILPEILSKEELSKGNGFLEMGTYLGVLGGCTCAGFIVYGIFQPEDAPINSMLYSAAIIIMPLCACIGSVVSFFIPRVPAAYSEKPWTPGLNPKTFVTNWRILRSRKGLLRCVYGLSVFWAVSTLFLLNAPFFGTAYLGYSQRASAVSNTYLIIAISIGIGIGCYLGGRLSKGEIKLTLVTKASILWIICSLMLAAVGFSIGRVEIPLTVMEWVTRVLLCIGGIAGGIYVVPINTYIEYFSPPEHRASCIGTSNILTVVAMLVAVALNTVLIVVFQQSPSGIFLVLGLLFIVLLKPLLALNHLDSSESEPG